MAVSAIELVVSDMAGTTVRDDGLVERAFTDALGGMGVDPAGHVDFVRGTMGQSKIVVFRAIFAGDEARARDANGRFEEAFARRVAAGEAVALPGARDALAELRELGAKVCLTTGFAATTRDSIIDALGWGDLIDLALSPTRRVRGRPHPDLVLEAVIELRVSGVAAVAVVGDTTADLEAGSRAGASVVAGVLTGAHPYERLVRAPHTHILRGIGELPRVVAARRGTDRPPASATP